MDLPAGFVAKVSGAFGEQGRTWLEQLPGLLAGYAARWSLQPGQPYPLSYNYVVSVVCPDGSPAVLKLGVPNPELTSEAAALALYDGRSAVRLFDADVAGGALLLERLVPGGTLEDLADDDAATSVAAEVMRGLWCPLPADHPFPDLQRWSRSLRTIALPSGGIGPLSARHVNKARRLFDELIPFSDAPVLLHGDLHPGNILHDARRGWLAIDPKGLAGEPIFETGAWLRNPGIAGDSALRSRLDRRIGLFAGILGFDRRRILAWGFAQAVLSVCWSIEDGGEWAHWLPISDALESLGT